jgi:hypothetical protein
LLARHRVHRAQHRLIADAAAAQREQELHALDALVARRLSKVISAAPNPVSFASGARQASGASRALI